MVIQSNMSPKAIVDVWENTREIFEKYNVPLIEKALQSLVQEEMLSFLVSDLNKQIGSSDATCIGGG